MRRRVFTSLLGGAVIAPPVAAHAQQKGMPVIGFLHGASPPYAPYVDAFRQGLSDAGFVEGQNVAIEYRWAGGHYDQLPALAADLVGRKVDEVVACGGNLPALAAKTATSTIPIVFVSGGDPVQGGLVASLARPGGNVTGVSVLFAELTPKRLELLAELVPQARVFALLVNPSYADTERIIRDTLEAARAKGIELHILRAGSESEIDAAFTALVQLRAGALVVGNDPFFIGRREAARGAGGAPCGSDDLLRARICRFRRPDELCSEPHGCVSPGRRLRRKDPARRETGRSAGPATDYLRAGDQPEDRRGARRHRAAILPTK